jgi:predicted ATPase
MRLLSAVRIRGFRSIQNVEIPSLDGLTALVGRNSSGKSNFLRALNLFFNGEVDPGVQLDLARDFHARPKARKKKRIEISVDFELPAEFQFRSGLSQLQRVLGTSFTITKAWELNAQQQIVASTDLLRNGENAEDGETHARAFLNLVRFRYIPNRTIPAGLLKDESRAIANSMFAKMTGGVGTADVLEAVNDAAARLLRRASDSMARTGAPLSRPTMATPQTLAEMLSVSGFQAMGEHGALVRDEQWGSGNQAFFLYEVLQAVDTNYSRSFGWKQAAIWAVEEPESGLHRDLETRLADEFRTWTRDPKLKLQIVKTTHCPTFVMASDAGYWVELNNGSSVASATKIAKLVRDAELRGVTAWTQPVLAFPHRPVVIVEGPNDAEVLNHVASLIGDDGLLFLSLPDLDAATRDSGKDGIINYLKRYGALIANRPASAPLLVVFDWEVSGNDLGQAMKHYGPNGEARVVKMDESLAAPELGPEFSGIERFYPPVLVRQGHDAGEFVLGLAEGKPFSISKANLDAAKGKLKYRVLEIQDPTMLPQLVSVVRSVRAMV